MYKDLNDLLSQQEQFLTEMKWVLASIEELGKSAELTETEQLLTGNAIRLYEKMLEHAELVMLGCIDIIDPDFNLVIRKRFFRSTSLLARNNVIPQALQRELNSHWRTRNEATHAYHPMMDEGIISSCPRLVQAIDEFISHIQAWRQQ